MVWESLACSIEEARRGELGAPHGESERENRDGRRDYEDEDKRHTEGESQFLALCRRRGVLWVGVLHLVWWLPAGGGVSD